MAELTLESPKDVRKLIKEWIQQTTVSGSLPFKDGGIIVQMLNCFLKSFQMETELEVIRRIEELERRMMKREREKESE